MSQTQTTLAERLRQLRHSKQETLIEVGRAVDLTPSYLSRLESGERSNVSPDIAARMAAHFGTTVKWILTGKDEDPVELATGEYHKAIEDSGLRDEAAELAHQIAVLLDFFVGTDDGGRRLALPRIVGLLESFAAECSARNGAIRETGKSLARANFGTPSMSKLIDNGGETEIDESMQRWQQLLARVKSNLSGRGSQSDLAKSLGISRQSVHQYLDGKSAPNAEVTLRLLEWVKAMESKSGPEGASTPSEPKTQTQKSKHENRRSGPPGQ